MGLTLMGVVMGAIASWAITHAYHWMSEKKAARESPLGLLGQVSSDIEAIKKSLTGQSPSDPALAEVLRRSLDQIDHVKYVFRAALQNWFSEFTALKLLLRENDRAAVAEQVSRMDVMMKAMSSELKQPSGSEVPVSRNAKGGDSNHARQRTERESKA